MRKNGLDFWDTYRVIGNLLGVGAELEGVVDGLGAETVDYDVSRTVGALGVGDDFDSPSVNIVLAGAQVAIEGVSGRSRGDVLVWYKATLPHETARRRGSTDCAHRGTEGDDHRSN